MRAAAGVGQFDLHSTVDWERTTAFSFGYMGRVFINRADRYQEGTVSPDEYESVRNELIERLRSLSHPDSGDPLLQRVVPGSEVYHGANTDSAPDIVFEPTDWVYMMYGDFASDWFHPPKSRVADHDPEGIFVLAGPDIKHQIVDADAVDIAPTLLHLDGLPILEEMDGRILENVFTDRFRKERSPKTVPANRIDQRCGSDRATSDGVEDRLEDLGYL